MTFGKKGKDDWAIPRGGMRRLILVWSLIAIPVMWAHADALNVVDGGLASASLLLAAPATFLASWLAGRLPVTWPQATAAVFGLAGSWPAVPPGGWVGDGLGSVSAGRSSVAVGGEERNRNAGGAGLGDGAKHILGRSAAVACVRGMGRVGRRPGYRRRRVRFVVWVGSRGGASPPDAVFSPWQDPTGEAESTLGSCWQQWGGEPCSQASSILRGNGSGWV